MKKGFTLVELLIVVAIIGVLSTIGIPTFRRMIQKAKMAEAKIALGSGHRVEAAFFAEFNSYGNNLEGMGFEVEGVKPLPGGVGPPLPIYGFGFPPAINFCVPSGHLPSSSSAFGVTLANKTPEYFLGSKTSFVYPSAAAGMAGYCEYGPLTVDSIGAITGYVLTASGVISPKHSPLPADRAKMDIWTMDHNRNLVHLNDGTF